MDELTLGTVPPDEPGPPVEAPPMEPLGDDEDDIEPIVPGDDSGAGADDDEPYDA